MKTLLFGGSFDPIHNGHIKIAFEAKKELEADKLVFIPAKAPRWKTPSSSDKERLEMLSLALKPYSNYEISLIEISSQKDVNYTYETILNYPKKDDEELFYLIGYDQLEKLDKWYEIDKLSKMVRFVSYYREGYKKEEKNIEKYNVLLVPSKIISSMSSTKVRELNSLDMPLSVLKYIEKHNLYFIKTIKSYIKEKRFLHSCSVAHLAYEVALTNGKDANKAYIAAILHDVGKEIPLEEQKAFMDAYFKEYSDLNPALYHQFLSYDIAKKIFKIEDEEILDAIKYHATGSASLSWIGKTIYACDKVEPTRKFDTKPFNDLLKEDLEKGFLKVLETNIEFLEINNKDFSNPLTKECVKKYLGKDI